MRDGVPLKCCVDQVLVEADRLEDLRAAIGADGRDAHLGHDLQQALADAGEGALPALVVGEAVLERGAAVEVVIDSSIRYGLTALAP